MPRYDYICKCGKVQEEIRTVAERDKVPHCNKCNAQTKRKEVYPISRDWFRPHMNEHISSDGPVFIESKKQYKDLCKQHGVTARCLM